MKKGKPAPRRNKPKPKSPVAKMAMAKKAKRAAMIGAMMTPQGPLGSGNY